MSSETPRRTRDRAGTGGSPMGSTAAIIIAIVAVVGGFLILREIRDDGDAGGGATVPSATTLPPETTVDPALTTTTLPQETTTTEPEMVVEGATAVVANASTVDGAAGVLTTALTGQGFTMAKATNASERRTATVVYYDEGNPAAFPVARSIAGLMGEGVNVEPLPSPPPVSDGSLPEGVTVLVMLASDRANMTLAQMGSATTTPTATSPGLDTTTTTAAP